MAVAFYIKAALGWSDVLDYFTAENAVFPQGTKAFSVGRNSHPLIVYPESEVAFVDFPGVLTPSGLVKVTLYWAALVNVGNVLWELAWERDNATVFIPQADLDINSFAASKTVVSPAPVLSGTLREASIVFTPAERGGTVPGEPYRLRVKRSAGTFPDFMPGDAQLFRVVIGSP
jgi:hypothetical protein